MKEEKKDEKIWNKYKRFVEQNEFKNNSKKSFKNLKTSIKEITTFVINQSKEWSLALCVILKKKNMKSKINI